MVILHVTYKLKAGARDSFIAALEAGSIAEKTASEPGCIKYDFSIPLKSGDDMFLCEVWASGEALEEHFAGENIAELNIIKNEFALDTIIEKFNVG